MGGRQRTTLFMVSEEEARRLGIKTEEEEGRGRRREREEEAGKAKKKR